MCELLTTGQMIDYLVKHGGRAKSENTGAIVERKDGKIVITENEIWGNQEDGELLACTTATLNTKWIVIP